jgi:hypothetical protein
MTSPFVVSVFVGDRLALKNDQYPLGILQNRLHKWMVHKHIDAMDRTIPRYQADYEQLG